MYANVSNLSGARTCIQHAYVHLLSLTDLLPIRALCAEHRLMIALMHDNVQLQPYEVQSMYLHNAFKLFICACKQQCGADDIQLASMIAGTLHIIYKWLYQTSQTRMHSYNCILHACFIRYVDNRVNTKHLFCCIKLFYTICIALLQ
jgi:hypothetical protein